MVLSIASLPQMPVLSAVGRRHAEHPRLPAVRRRPVALSRRRAPCAATSLARPFYYPPFLFAFFRWLRPLTLESDDAHLDGVPVHVFDGDLLPLGPEDLGRAASATTAHEIVAFCVLLLFQYPFVFALERGNTDSVNVLFYTLAAFLFVRGRHLAGRDVGGDRGWFQAVADHRDRRHDGRAVSRLASSRALGLGPIRGGRWRPSR